MENPFYYSIKADDIPEDEVNELFVPSACPVWDEVRLPVNQIIVGARGVGKTIMLKRLHYLNALFYDDHVFFGLYIRLSRLANIFHFREETTESRGATLKTRAMFGDYLVAEACREAAHALIHCLAAHNLKWSRSLDNVFIGSVTDVMLQDASAAFTRTQSSIEEAYLELKSTGATSWGPKFEPEAVLARLAQRIAGLFRESGMQTPEIYLLCDESAPIPRQCQEVVNSLLQRGRPFKTKLAIRPYEWDTRETIAGHKIEEGTDYRFVRIEHANALSSEYIKQMQAIANAVIRSRIARKRPDASGWPANATIDIATILQHGDDEPLAGFDSVCAFSSGNPQSMLTVCSNIFHFAAELGILEDGVVPTIPPNIQRQGILACSEEAERGIPDETSREVAAGLYKHIEELPKKDRGLLIDVKKDDMFRNCLLDPDAKLVENGFAVGVFRCVPQRRGGLWEVPLEFVLSRSLLPYHNLPLDLSREKRVSVDEGFLRQCAKRYTRRRVSAQEGQMDLRERRISAFLSTSFSACVESDRRALKDALKDVRIDCEDCTDKGRETFLYTDVIKKIRAHDVTILNATEITPFTMFEAGFCAGLPRPKPFVTVFNDGGDPSSAGRFPEFMRLFSIHSYSPTAERLSELCKKVRQTVEHLLSEPSEFRYISPGNVTLRPKRRETDTVYFSHGDGAVWSPVKEALRSRLEEAGFRMFSDMDQRVYLANTLQLAVFCASHARVAAVDTTGVGGADLLQWFRLGVACAQSDARVVHLHEERLAGQIGGLSVVTVSQRERWKTADDIVEAVMRAVAAEKNKKGAK